MRLVNCLPLLGVLLALPLGAATLNDFSKCQALGSESAADKLSVGSGNQRLCFDFDETLSGTTSGAFVVSNARASMCLNPDRNGTGGTAVVDVQACPGTDAISDNTCFDTGVTLNAASPCGGQTFSANRYRFQVTAGATAGEDARVTVEAYQ